MPEIKKDATDVSRYILLQDSTTGVPETGYTITDLDLQYTRNRATPAAKVDATALGATNTAHTDNYAIEIDGTSSPGLYRVDWPDAAFATGADKVTLVVSGTGLHPAVEEITLVDASDFDLAAIAVDVAGLDGDAMVGTDGALLAANVNVAAGIVESNVKQISDDETAANNLELALENGSAGYIASDLREFRSDAQSAIDLKDFADAGYDPSANKVEGVKLVDTTTTNTDMVGTDGALLAANVNVAAGIVESNVKQISDDETAANNLESQYDGDGLSGDVFPATQAQVGNLSTGSAAISTTVTSTEDTLPAVTGTPTNDYTYTIEQDSQYHSWVPDVFLEFAYNFNIGSNASPVDAIWIGYCQSNNDDVGVYARNWVGTSWEQVGTIEGTIGTTEQTVIFNLTTAHVNTGANSGDVRLRFYSAGGSVITTFATDRLLLSYTITNQSVGYSNGAIWIDSAASNTNTVDYVDGVADNPVSTLAAALTISDSIGIKRFEVAPQSALTFAQDMTGYRFAGNNYSIDLNGQNSDSLLLEGATITGELTSSSSVGMLFCRLSNGCTIPSGGYGNCTLPGDITLSGTFYMFDACVSAVAGTNSPSIDLGAVGAQSVNFRHYSGGITVKNFAAADAMSLEGFGQLVIDSTCSGGTIAIRGHFSWTDEASGVVTLVELSNFDHNTIIDDILVDTNETQGKLPTNDIMGSSDKTDQDGKLDTIQERTDNLPNDPASETNVDANETKIDTVIANIGTPADIDFGGATIADNLKKIADDNAGATFDATTDSLQKIREDGDNNWATGGGGAVDQILRVSYSVPNIIDLAGTATVRIGIILGNAVDDLPTALEITPGTISIDRKAIGGTSWASIVSDAAMSEADGLIYYDEVFDTGTGYAEGDTIRITFKGQLITVSGNDFEIHSAAGVMFQTGIKQTMRGTDNANTVVPYAADAEVDVGKIKGTALTETNPGDVADNVSQFFDVEPTTTNTVDDVGGAGGGGDATEAKQDQIIAAIGTPVSLDGGATTVSGMIIKMADDAGGASFDAGDDSLRELRINGDANWVTGGGGTAQQVIDALMAHTGWTEGGTMTVETLYKLWAGLAGGTWRDKAGDSDTKQLLDVDDDSTVILEMTLSQTTPQKEADVQ